MRWRQMQGVRLEGIETAERIHLDPVPPAQHVLWHNETARCKAARRCNLLAGNDSGMCRLVAPAMPSHRSLGPGTRECEVGGHGS